MSTHVERITEVRSNDGDDVASPMTLAARVVWYIAGVVISLIAFRFVLILLGANPANDFVNFIYTITYPLVRPFFGIFSYTVRYGISRVEMASLVAMAVYALIAYGVARLLMLGRDSDEL